ncbi:VOC family protein [Staphylococcus xylosus]|uniref:VOC family protein n=1 Tax=Staphylococcus xylosus TaxID=1288 RepID=UPI000852C5B0|nr:VOC family protein [Staphylococcus xylosus]MBM6638633.1 VOC family protein [Staphylococcus xylosus]MCA2499419.1 VOC family protein [Staphylococcus xylosus]MCA2503242.1 VOC family protein [Staphylococcus xylosus]MCE7779125.1 VOC family protein [Staphylococcus xylosus]MDW8554684.1 VOC family protein [Staphylococcus xylosus]
MSFHDNQSIQVTSITLNVADLAKMTTFYTQILGLSIKSESNRDVTFNIGSGGHTLTLQEVKDVRRPSIRESGLFHIALLLPNRQDLGNFLYHAASLGVQIGGGDHLVSEALYFDDPEGNGIEIYADRPKENWLWEDNKVNMDTLAVDVDDLVAQRSKAGWQDMPDGAKIGHLHLKAANLETSQDFYLNKLGLEHISDFPQALFMSTNHYHHHIAINTWQSNIVRQDNDSSLGLAKVSIYKPNADRAQFEGPEGFEIIIHSNESFVADKI